MSAAGVYALRNVKTGDTYVGGSAQLPARRSGHFSSLKAGKHSNARLQASYDQHGADAFVFEVLEHCPVGTDVGECESRWCEKLKPSLNIDPPGRHIGNAGDTRYVVSLTVDMDRQIREYAKYMGFSSITMAMRNLIARQLRRESEVKRNECPTSTSTTKPAEIGQ